MDIKEIKRIVELLKKVNCLNYATIAEVAKEMSAKKTALMQFIEDNPKLFKLGEAYKYSTKNGKTSLGLAIIEVYLVADENPETEEWLAKMKKEWENKIHVGERTYYSCHEYWYIPEDDPNDNDKTYAAYGKYRNTPEKIKELADAGIIEKISRTRGGLGDCWKDEVYIFTGKVKKAIEDYGWSTDFELETTGE